MRLLISSRQLGTDKSLLYDGTSLSWVDDKQEYFCDSLLYGFDGIDSCEAVDALGLEVPRLKSTPWFLAMSYFKTGADKIPWRMCMPTREWKLFTKNLVDCLWINFNSPDNHYYVSTFKRNTELIRSLREAYVDVSVINDLSKSATDNSRLQMSKFIPAAGDRVAPRSKYSLSKSVTGRMTITEGPNILTLKKEYRKILKSRWGQKGKIYEIDIQSVVPRVALSFFGKSVPGDVYSSVMNHVDVKIDRATAKIATLSAIYGASHHTLAGMLPESTNALKVLQSVKDFFGIRHIEKMLKEQHDLLGFIKNSHGRKIFSDSPSVNHLIQSSSVDVSFDVFESLMQRFTRSNIKFNPIYFIHDAIIIDVHADSIDRLFDMVREEVYVKNVNQKFPVNIKEIS